MKYFITGLHSSGKQQVLDILSSQNIRCGKLFSNIESPSTDIYNSFNYELFTNIDINDIFEINDFESFAKRCKLAKDYLDKYIEDLCNDRDYYFELMYEDWIEMKKEEAEEEDRELSDEEINIDNFYENISDLDYNYNYENYNNIDEALYILTESGDELSLPDDRIFIY